MKIKSIIAFWLFLIASFSGQCQIRIAMSRATQNYENWLRNADSTVAPINLYNLGIDSAVQLLATCSGLLLTGGEDVYPGYYGKLNEIGKCEEIDRYRDSLEFALIAKAISLDMPVFGICRGEQILNVALGGTLYTDIPTDVDTSIFHRCPPGSSGCFHTITIDKESLLFKITGQTSGTVNSYHHQAAEIPPPGFTASARSTNKVIEAIERKNPDDSPFIMGVQWHPEGMIENPDLSGKLGSYFLEQARKYGEE